MQNASSAAPHYAVLGARDTPATFATLSEAFESAVRAVREATNNAARSVTWNDVSFIENGLPREFWEAATVSTFVFDAPVAIEKDVATQQDVCWAVGAFQTGGTHCVRIRRVA